MPIFQGEHDEDVMRNMILRSFVNAGVVNQLGLLARWVLYEIGYERWRTTNHQRRSMADGSGGGRKRIGRRTSSLALYVKDGRIPFFSS